MTIAAPLAAALAVALLASPAVALHKQLAPVVRLTADGDNHLPRVAVPTGAFAIPAATGAGAEIRLLTFRGGIPATSVLSSSGAPDLPTVARRARLVAWEATAGAGRQVVLQTLAGTGPAAIDPTGTSANPALSERGQWLAFESEGDLAGTGNAGARQIFLRAPDGSIRQASTGRGTSRNPTLGWRGRVLAFESTSDPETGDDTGIAQVWLGLTTGAPPAPVTAGAGPSRRPAFSSDGRVLAFESEADLAGDGADTGAPQIYVLDRPTGTYARVTDDPAGCTAPAAAKYGREWRVVYTCGGRGFYYELASDRRFRLPVFAGEVRGALPVLGNHFVAVATTANLLEGGVTPTAQLFVVNLFRRPPTLEAGAPAVWFPFRGIRPRR